MWLSAIPSISTKQTFHLKSLNITCGIGNPFPGLGQAHKCVRVQPCIAPFYFLLQWYK